jgi:transposase-like protein
VKKDKRAIWSEEQVQQAVSDVINKGCSVKKSAIVHGIPCSTLRRHVLKFRAGQSVVKKLGRNSILSVEQESELVALIKDMVKRLFGLSQMDIRRLVFKYCDINNIPNSFNTTERAAGRDWFEAFLRRHTDLAVRTPEPTSVQRAVGFNEAKAKIFFEKLGNILFDETGKRLIPETQIYNVDESGYSICHKPSKVIAQRGQRGVGALTSAEKGKTVTTICCMSASGHYVPPMIIFPRKRVKPELMDRAPVGAVSAANPTGWVNEDIFAAWFDHFILSVQPKSRPYPTLLILDGHSSHTKNLSMILKARENNVKILSLPSHCTHKLQPLDVSFFKSANSFYDSAVQNWIRQHCRPVSEWQIAELFAEAYSRAATTKNALSGFEECGIHPFNPSKFDSANFLPSELTDRPEEAPGSSSSSVPASVLLSPASPSEVGPLVPELTLAADPQQHFAQINSPSHDNLETESCKESSGLKSPSTSFHDLVPVPHLSSGPISSKRKRAVNHAELLTSSPYKAQLELNVNSGSKKKVSKCKRSQDKIKKNGRKAKQSSQAKVAKHSCKKQRYEDDAACLYCNERWSDSVEGEWVKCQGVCGDWAHAFCAGVGKKDKQFICERCQ